MLLKGDIVLISDPLHDYAGFTGTVKKTTTKNTRVIIKLIKNKKTVWIHRDSLVKINKSQQEKLELVLKEKS